MEIRPKRPIHPFAYYAYILNDFREELFRKCVNWKLPAESFVPEFDPLFNFYSRILGYNGDASENNILNNYLIRPLKLFLFSLDIEFQTNYYFYKKMKMLENFEFSIKVVSSDNHPVKQVELKIFKFEDLNLKSMTFIESTKTSKEGNIEVHLTEGIYKTEIEKYGFQKVCYLTRNNRKVIFQVSKKKHWWQ